MKPLLQFVMDGVFIITIHDGVTTNFQDIAYLAKPAGPGLANFQVRHVASLNPWVAYKILIRAY